MSPARPRSLHSAAPPSTRPSARVRTSLTASVVAVTMLLSGCGGVADDRTTVIAGEDAGLLRVAVENAIEQIGAEAAIVRVTRGDDVLLTQAWGESMAGVPATVDMHFRNGAVAIPQVATVLLHLDVAAERGVRRRGGARPARADDVGVRRLPVE